MDADSTKEVTKHVARASPKTHFALVLRRVSFQIEPTGPATSFAAASSFFGPKSYRELDHVRRCRHLSAGSPSCARADRRFFHTYCGRPFLLRTNRGLQLALGYLRDGWAPVDRTEYCWFPDRLGSTKSDCCDLTRRSGQSCRGGMCHHRRPFHSQSRANLRTGCHRSDRCSPSDNKRKCAPRRSAGVEQTAGHRHCH